jgi:photosystem II stability/assembly factor-like uncharacterized protein
MNDPNETTRLLRVDRMIDEIVAGRSGPQRARTPASAPQADEALVAELSGLTLIDWPPDEAGDRIARGVALGAGRTERLAPGGRRRSRRRPAHPRRWLAAGLAAAAAVLLAVVALFGPWAPGASRPQAPGTSRAGAAIQVTIPRHGIISRGVVPPGLSQHMQLVASASSPFRSVGRGPQAPFLQCATASVCYAWDLGPHGDGMERTSDGGTTWRPIAALPDGRSLAQDDGWSCPSAETCVAVAGPRLLAVTADGGGHWRLESVPAPRGSSGASLDQVSCPTALRCVVHFSDRGPGAFLSTVDGGRTWTAAATVPQGSPKGLWLLRCDPDGHCIGLDPVGTASADDLAAMRSTDGGRTWAAYSVHLPPTGILLLSCGDARHCMVVTADGITMTTTSDGGATWRESAAPATWPGIATDLSCATGLDCFIAAADPAPGPVGYDHPVVEATYNGGSTWTTISLPAVARSPLVIVFPLSCPSQAGCIGAAATAREFSGVQPGREIISSFPAPGQPLTGS